MQVFRLEWMAGACREVAVRADPGSANAAETVEQD